MTDLANQIAALSAVETRFYIDCEFDGHNGALLSIALVKDDGDGIHIKTTAPITDDWVRANVLPLMDRHKAPKSASVGQHDVGGAIRAFIGNCECPVIIADSPVDIGRFCRALSTGSDGLWASADYPMMRFEVHNVDCYPTDLPGAVQHNAWWDAMALNRKLSIAALRAAGEVEALRATLKWYADQFCEYPDNEGCGKYEDDTCAGCHARKALEAKP